MAGSISKLLNCNYFSWFFYANLLIVFASRWMGVRNGTIQAPKILELNILILGMENANHCLDERKFRKKLIKF